MYIRITCVTDEKAGQIINEILVAMQEAFNIFFPDRNYGDLEQFTVVVVAVDSDTAENDKFLKGFNKIGSFKNPFTQNKVKYIGFGIPFDPMAIEKMVDDQFKIALCDALLNRLDNPALKIPKNFDYNRFACDMKDRLEIFKRAMITN